MNAREMQSIHLSMQALSRSACVMYVVSYVSSWNSFESGLSVSEPQQRSKSRGDETNRRTRAKPQWIVGQAYSHTYSTLSQLSRLQTIWDQNSVKCSIRIDKRTYSTSPKPNNGLEAEAYRSPYKSPAQQ